MVTPAGATALAAAGGGRCRRHAPQRRQHHAGYPRYSGHGGSFGQHNLLFRAVGRIGAADENSTANRNYFQAAVAQEYGHLLYPGQLGAEPIKRHFYFPDKMFTDESVFFPNALLLEEY